MANGYEADKLKLESKVKEMKSKFEKQWNELRLKNSDLQHLLDAMKHDMKDQCNENQSGTVVVIQTCQFMYLAIISFFRENVVGIPISELRPVSNERYENSTFYGLFIFLILILIFH